MAMIYTEGPSKRWQTIAFETAALGAAMLALGIVVDVGAVVGIGLLLLILCLIVGITVFSMRRYSTIELDAVNLRVGRDQVAVSELASVLDKDQLPQDVLGRAMNPMPTKGAGGKLFGGGWGLGARLEPVGFTTTTNPELQIIGTRNPAELAQELRSALRSAT